MTIVAPRAYEDDDDAPAAVPAVTPMPAVTPTPAAPRPAAAAPRPASPRPRTPRNRLVPSKHRMSLRRSTADYRRVVSFRVSLGARGRKRPRRLHPMRLRLHVILLRAKYRF